MRGYNDLSDGGLEVLTGFSEVIQSDHTYIHKGLAHTYSDIKSIVAGGTFQSVIKTPTILENRFIHWRPLRVATSASGIIYTMTEDPTFSGGTDVSSYIWNRNRNFKNILQSRMTLIDDVSVTSSGEILEKIYIGEGGSRRNSAGGDSRADEEILLKADTSYLIKIENDGGIDTMISLYYFWYEELGWDGRD